MFSCGLKQPIVKIPQSSHVCVHRRASWRDECINMTIWLEDLQPQEVPEHFIIRLCCTETSRWSSFSSWPVVQFWALSQSPYPQLASLRSCQPEIPMLHMLWNLESIIPTIPTALNCCETNSTELETLSPQSSNERETSLLTKRQHGKITTTFRDVRKYRYNQISRYFAQWYWIDI